MPYRVGLTGGIGSGKSTVAGMFARMGVPVIDADQIARAVVEPATPGLASLVEHFGSEILTDGVLNRRRLREIIFSDADEKAWVESLLHPLIKTEIIRLSSLQDQPYIVLEIPLLLEAGYGELVDRILVVNAPPELQVERVVRRDHVQPGQIEAIIGTQIAASDRLLQADDVIENVGDLDELQRMIEGLHTRYLSLSQEQD